VRLAAALTRRREIIGIIDWLASETGRLGVDLRCNLLAEAGDVTAEAPDVVVIATAGVPDTSFLAEGEDLVITSWDILSGQVVPARRCCCSTTTARIRARRAPSSWRAGAPGSSS
jgi:hypothetical protein